ncbi:DUF4136 domain-containing protein [Carboxylicivirga sediminis]|uniref:DUF4136 domain-containing protein n=1 Tax=Carboxylicivirga sediminis TaxID=2006564 RepID=A0A941F9N1_9BACT|nr:DUF4136 domain-containing protein [Carboxylicivirga sediminis]MBR8537640.1 DUF4136 domain-containing protein [Carboxylicivirga sediminis]
MKRIVFFILSVWLFSACSSVRTTADWDPSADFRGYQSFNFSESFEEIKLNDLDKRRVKNAVQTEMEKRGYVLSTQPDLLINGYVTSVEKTVVTNTHYGGYGPYFYGWGGWYTSTDVNNYREGTLIVSLIDVRKKQMIWEGRAEGIAPPSGGEKRTKAMDEMIERLFWKYPIK